MPGNCTVRPTSLMQFQNAAFVKCCQLVEASRVVLSARLTELSDAQQLTGNNLSTTGRRHHKCTLLGVLYITDPCYFWHITDIHYDDLYVKGGDTMRGCRATESGLSGASKPAGRFGDFNCDSPLALVDSAASAMRSKHGENIEFVLWTGEGLLHVPGTTGDHELILLQNLTHLLKHTFSSQFVFPVLGHQDPIPPRNDKYHAISKMWRNWLPPEAISTFEKGGYYSIELKMNKLRIVVLNTNLFREDVNDLGQWEWLENKLRKSHSSKGLVYLVGHVPPGVDERKSGQFTTSHSSYSYHPHFNMKYLELVRNHADIIMGQFFGHLHSDSFRVVYGNKGHPVSWMFIAPSVTPRRMYHSGANNPGLRLYKFDSDTGQVLDYVQYYLDLVAANERDTAEWQVEYNFTSYYGQREVSPHSLNELAQSFNEPSGGKFFDRYHRANSVRLPPVCDANCVHRHYCAITRLDFNDFRSCVQAAPSALAAAKAARSFSWKHLLLPPLLVLFSLCAS
ncbi:cyclic GMP-AMP phosphodiesterase SMPDL3A [Anabrus simplex]|uniref:cyclic GMP-AMP phosphodiesterase SMPDL3A n=1 Tax=Anabrus simplex TaxID=316456 RepID=UPI0035A270AA